MPPCDLAPVFLPMPRRWVAEQGAITLQNRRVTIWDETRSAERVVRRLKSDLFHELRIEATPVADSDKGRSSTILLRTNRALPSQGYHLRISSRHIVAEAPDPAGLFYAAMTLRQLIRQYRDSLPACLVEDWPDFAVRGAMLDISRDKVPTMETLYRLIDHLAEWKINRFELYIEHTFAYSRHRAVWEGSDPLTPEEARALDRYCEERFMDLVPNQNCFGHLHRWLEKEPYRMLAECPNGFRMPWGEWREGPFSLNPLDPRSIALIEELLTELAPNFRSGEINVGCDETFDLGQGASKEACERWGKGRVYLDFLLKIHRLAERLAKRMNFWGDIVLNHPEVIADLPRDVVPLVWGYEADHPFEPQCAAFKNAGLRFIVCPGTSSWNSLLGRADNARANILNAAEHGLAAGAMGLMVTAWGDNGHWQPFPVDLWPIAMAAAISWCADTNRKMDLSKQLDRHVFRDEAGRYGRLAWELGTLYRELHHPLVNASALFRLLSQRRIDNLISAIPPERLRLVRRRLADLRSELTTTRSLRDDEGLVRAEWDCACALADCALARGLGEQAPWADVLEAYRAQWLARNRPGGLEDSIAPLRRRAEASPGAA